MKILLAFMALVLGGLIYIIFRTDSLIMFNWFKVFGLNNIIDSLRLNYGTISINEWVKYNMPAALWLLSYLLIMQEIWIPYKYKYSYYVFLWCLPIMAIISEVLQLWHIIPGTYDIIDIATYTLSILIFIVINKFHI